MLSCLMCGTDLRRVKMLTIFKVHEEMLDFCSKDCLSRYMKQGRKNDVRP